MNTARLTRSVSPIPHTPPPPHFVNRCDNAIMPRPQTQSKAEWLLGYTHAQMSYHKALEVLGVSEAVVEEERARRLGELGLASWGGTSLSSEACAGQEGDDLCGGFFTKRRRSASQDTPLGTTLPGEVAFAPAHVRPEAIKRRFCTVSYTRYCIMLLLLLFVRSSCRKRPYTYWARISVRCPRLFTSTSQAVQSSSEGGLYIL